MADDNRVSVGSVKDVMTRFWRTDLRLGRSVYVLLSNDVDVPSEMDPLLGVMESSSIAEDVVNSHNGLLYRYGRKYPERIVMGRVE
jgi:hypothetical protein